MTLEEDDPVDQLVGVVHLLDGFGPLLVGQALEAPVVEQTVVNPILVDGPEFEKERFVKPLDDLCVAFHFHLQVASICASVSSWT